MNNRWMLTICAALLLISGCSSLSERTEEPLKPTRNMDDVLPVSSTADAFDQQKAVAAVLDDHPEFPLPGEVKEIETVTGGPAPGSKVTGTLATAVDKMSESDNYIVTLTKQWNLTINGQKLVGVWKYEVSPRGVQFIESKDNTVLVQTVK